MTDQEALQLFIGQLGTQEVNGRHCVVIETAEDAGELVHAIEAHLMQSHEGLMDAASAKYLIEKAERERNRMRAVFFVNMLKAFPDKASDEIMAEIDKACRDERMTDYMARTHAEFAESLKNPGDERGALCGPVKEPSDGEIYEEVSRRANPEAHAKALQELTELAQELDMGYGPNACPACGKSKP